jgi:prepilin-type N-terminal cleavage/methylation domain-containing protein
MINPYRRRQGGFTLVELMFGILIVSIAVLALYQMFISGNQMITEEYHRREALQKAQAIMELAKYYETVRDTVPQNIAGTFQEQLIPPMGDNEEGIQAEYTLTVVPSSVRDRNGVAIYSAVCLTYNWVEFSGKEESIVLQTYF